MGRRKEVWLPKVCELKFSSPPQLDCTQILLALEFYVPLLQPPLINNDRSLISTMKRPCFTKLAVSPLILVRFSKFEVWHAQHFDPDLPDISDVTRDVTGARWRHARASDPRHSLMMMSCPFTWRHLYHGNQRHGLPSTVNLMPVEHDGEGGPWKHSTGSKIVNNGPIWTI